MIVAGWRDEVERITAKALGGVKRDTYACDGCVKPTPIPSLYRAPLDWVNGRACSKGCGSGLWCRTCAQEVSNAHRHAMLSVRDPSVSLVVPA